MISATSFCTSRGEVDESLTDERLLARVGEHVTRLPVLIVEADCVRNGLAGVFVVSLPLLVNVTLSPLSATTLPPGEHEVGELGVAVLFSSPDVGRDERVGDLPARAPTTSGRAGAPSPWYIQLWSW